MYKMCGRFWYCPGNYPSMHPSGGNPEALPGCLGDIIICGGTCPNKCAGGGIHHMPGPPDLANALKFEVHQCAPPPGSSLATRSVVVGSRHTHHNLPPLWTCGSSAIGPAHVAPAAPAETLMTYRQKSRCKQAWVGHRVFCCVALASVTPLMSRLLLRQSWIYQQVCCGQHVDCVLPALLLCSRTCWGWYRNTQCDCDL